MSQQNEQGHEMPIAPAYLDRERLRDGDGDLHAKEDTCVWFRLLYTWSTMRTHACGLGCYTRGAP